MSTVVSRTRVTAALPDPPNPIRPFFSILGRDLIVTRRELPVFLAQVVLQPVFLLLIFGRIIVHIGYANPKYIPVLFPGIVAMAAVITGLQSTSFSLVIDFSYTREIEDRLMAPLPTSLIAIEKLLFATIRALIASVLMFPLGVIVLGSVPWRLEAAPTVGIILVLGAIVGAAIGLALGTMVPTNRINMVFALLMTPLVFTGCSEYAWPTLESMRWFQVITTFNPLTYVSEGLRGALVPGTPHIAGWICLVGLVASAAALVSLSVRGFLRKARD